MKLLVPTARVRCWFNPVLSRGHHRSRISCGEVHRNHDRSGEKTFRGRCHLFLCTVYANLGQTRRLHQRVEM